MFSLLLKDGFSIIIQCLQNYQIYHVKYVRFLWLFLPDTNGSQFEDFIIQDYSMTHILNVFIALKGPLFSLLFSVYKIIKIKMSSM